MFRKVSSKSFLFLSFFLYFTLSLYGEEKVGAVFNISHDQSAIKISLLEPNAVFLKYFKSRSIGAYIIDITPKLKSLNKTIKEPLPTSIEKIRVTAHADFYRIRIDINKAALSNLVVLKSDREIILSIDANKVAVPTYTASPAPTKHGLVSVIPSFTSTNTVLPTSAVSVIPTASTTPTTTMPPTASVLVTQSPAVPTLTISPTLTSESVPAPAIEEKSKKIVKKAFFTPEKFVMEYDGELPSFEIQELGENQSKKGFVYKVILPGYTLNNKKELSMPYFAPVSTPNLLRVIMEEQKEEKRVILNILSDSNLGIEVAKDNQFLNIRSR